MAKSHVRPGQIIAASDFGASGVISSGAVQVPFMLQAPQPCAWQMVSFSVPEHGKVRQPRKSAPGKGLLTGEDPSEGLVLIA